jgi:hypothetical protein
VQTQDRLKKDKALKIHQQLQLLTFDETRMLMLMSAKVKDITNAMHSRCALLCISFPELEEPLLDKRRPSRCRFLPPLNVFSLSGVLQLNDWSLM